MGYGIGHARGRGSIPPGSSVPGAPRPAEAPEADAGAPAHGGGPPCLDARRRHASPAAPPGISQARPHDRRCGHGRGHPVSHGRRTE
ncbi:hypothetical protein SAM23877_6939 [Streptomyces ambofaciens ATCC 23877]|uniref:Uncharacterized protein n=1 Tax=Streptomyces ambofaciens (strain ATCC 23877 / 3486 / DSM 40053 / JCM 4204 / NBRC 12836 / NRRL B-2516) TaxID=278992 RepID=A0A0K2B3Y2_STRA7|nr:hypothetical protein SAM23877_6939 [Streptomyces ambofaciens ATCC 23877]